MIHTRAADRFACCIDGRIHVRGLLVFATLGVVLSLQSSHAQGPGKNPLALAKSLTCNFSVSASGSWKGGEPRAEVKAETISIELVAANSLHFLERSLQGNLTVITVFSEPDPKGRYRAVRSRHSYLKMAIPGFVAEPTVSQQYGECEVKP
jgi:hypothetical protein